MSEPEDDEGLGLKMGTLRVDDDDVFGDMGKEGSEKKGKEEDSPINIPSKSSQKGKPKDAESIRPPSKKKSEAPPPSSDIEDPLTLRL